MIGGTLIYVNMVVKHADLVSVLSDNYVSHRSQQYQDVIPFPVQ